jgi:hypothetical protein
VTETPAPRPSGIDPETGEWHPAFPGQRPPFPQGHTYSLRHGAHSEARIRPLADKIAADVLAELGLSADALEAEMSERLTEYARAQATADLLWDWMAGGGMEAILGYYEAWQRASGRARRLSDRLGLREARLDQYRRELAEKSRARLASPPYP